MFLLLSGSIRGMLLSVTWAAWLDGLMKQA
jgi:hypothetical protein